MSDLKLGDIVYLKRTLSQKPTKIVVIGTDGYHGIDYGIQFYGANRLGGILPEMTGWWTVVESLCSYQKDNAISRLLYPERIPYKGYLCKKQDLAIIKKLLA